MKDSQHSILDQVIQGALLGYWDWNCQTGEHHVNDRWLEMLGLTRADERQHESDWSDRIHPEDKERVMPVIREHIVSGETYEVEFRMEHRAGFWVWILGSGAVVEYDSENAPLRLCGIHQDITKRKQLEEERSQLIVSLQKALGEIRTLKGIIPICSYCHKIRDDQGAWEALESYISKYSDAAFSHGVCPKCLPRARSDMGLGDLQE